MHLAKTRDVNVVITKASKTKGFTNLITVTLKADRDQEYLVAGTLLQGYGERIVQVNKFPVDIAPEGHQIFVSHNDKVGIIGLVGTLLGENDVNIASMQVGRKIVGGAAIMLLTVDKAVPKQVLVKLAGLPEINTAEEIILL
jgi:D-3-phosphoglycerate dehydrogenase